MTRKILGLMTGLALMWSVPMANAIPIIELEKSVNGEDADQAPGIEIPVGDTVTWTYKVTNPGDVVLSIDSLIDSHCIRNKHIRKSAQFLKTEKI